MPKESLWKELIKPTIIAYLLACSIPAGIAAAYYIYSSYF